MNTNEQLLRERLVAFATTNSSTDYVKVANELKALLDDLAKSDIVTFSDEYCLGGAFLERRVRMALERIGFTVHQGRPLKEDLVCPPPESRTFSHPLVWEVKSGRKPCASTDHLRQLDDWVFDLSGESTRRVDSLNSQRVSGTQIYLFGDWIPPHNTAPVKGVFLYNGYVADPSVPFRDRPKRVALDANELDFAKSRGFCALTLESLLSWERAVLGGRCNALDVWDRLQQTLGELGPYPQI